MLIILEFFLDLLVFRGACPFRNRTCESVSQSVSESQKSLKQHHKLEITGYGPVWSHMVPYGCQILFNWDRYDHDLYCIYVLGLVIKSNLS